LDLLTRDSDEKTFNLVFIDYKSLGVRQLGSIYEGLLEFKLRIASEKMAVCKGKKTEEVVPYREAKTKNLKVLTIGRGKDAKERIYKPGDVYLENDRHERKITGSYYTPNYIVEYIVENTVGPVLEEKFEALRPKLREAEKAYRDAVKRKEAFEKQGMRGDDPEKVANTYEHVVRELFDVKALDPAMGSGHFLVEAVDFITDKMLDFLNGFPWNPVISQLNTMRETILHEMEEQGITIDAARLTDVNLLKRHVLKRCIYGVDLNPMAVELAKVSLWLDCFTLGAPLSFFDHHLKCGNSLVGAENIEEHIPPRSGRREAFIRAVGELLQITALADATSTEVHTSQKLYREATSLLEPTRKRLNVQVSRHFQEFDSEAELHHAWAFAHQENEAGQESSGLDLRTGSRKKFFKAQEIAGERRFLHWELEFPEIFYGMREDAGRVFERRPNPGFDAVIGNPPYVRQEALTELKPYLKAAFPKVYNGIADIYVYFYGRGLGILRKGGRFGMITSNKFMRANYGKTLCNYLGNNHAVCEILDFGELPIFEDPMAYPCILICQAHTDEEVKPRFTKFHSVPIESLGDVVAKSGKHLPRAAISGE
ncbi:MAG: Eco57I restriction-modification methylase domain-containing protein, partial [Rubrivivax sp.]|nr:Eco57I restriction-modification methylase domain-containing protein [Rubrivivax sp.]